MRKNFNYEEFLELAKQLVDEQYGHEDKDFRELLKDSYEGEKIERAKRSLKLINRDHVYDFTDTKADDIGGLLKTAGNAQVGNFIVRIFRNGDEINSISIMEIRNKIHCNIAYGKDKRFKDADCLHGFKGSKNKFESTIDVIRWLQMIVRMSDFL